MPETLERVKPDLSDSNAQIYDHLTVLHVYHVIDASVIMSVLTADRALNPI